MNAVSPNVLLLSTADWDRPLWTNKQHLAVEIAPHCAHLYYVNSLGLRRPSLQRHDISRIGNVALASVSGRGRDHEVERVQSISVIRPGVAPYHRTSSPWHWFNARRLRARVARWLETPRETRILWTFSPVTYGLEEYAAATVYHSVDLLQNFPGVDEVAIAQGEDRMRRASDVAIASSAGVRANLIELGFSNVLLWENVAHSDEIARISGGETRAPGHLVFAGNLTPSKVDTGLLRAIVDQDASLVLHLAGTVAEGGGSTREIHELLRHPQVQFHGALSLSEMGSLLGKCTAGLIPYQDNAYTRGVFPMKVYEYLAAGLAVISTNMASLSNSCAVTRTVSRQDFLASAAAEASLPTKEAVAKRRSIALRHGWRQRGLDAVTLIDELLREDPTRPAQLSCS